MNFQVACDLDRSMQLLCKHPSQWPAKPVPLKEDRQNDEQYQEDAGKPDPPMAGKDPAVTKFEFQ